MHILCEVSRGTAPVRIIVHVRDTARLLVYFGYRAPLCYGLTSCVSYWNKNFKMDVLATRLFEQSTTNFADSYSE